MLLNGIADNVSDKTAAIILGLLAAGSLLIHFDQPEALRIVGLISALFAADYGFAIARKKFPRFDTLYYLDFVLCLWLLFLVLFLLIDKKNKYMYRTETQLIISFGGIFGALVGLGFLLGSYFSA